MGRQEQPAHPLPTVIAGVQGPNVRLTVADTILVRQEQPAHPLPLLSSGVRPLNVNPPTTSLLQPARQDVIVNQQPVLVSGISFSTLVPAVTRVVITRQEQPFHPLPFLSSGAYTNRPFRRGRGLAVRADI